MRRLLAVCVVLVLAGAANASVWVTWSGGPSPSDPNNYSTYVMTLTSSAGDYIVGWDGSVTGTLSQQYPFGNATIFMDNNNLFWFDPNKALDLDSQYLFDTNVKDPLNGVLVGASYEDTTELTAGFAMVGGRSNPNAGPVVDLAQLCVPVGMEPDLYWAGWVLLRDSQDVQRQYWVEGPEPATLALLSVGSLIVLRRRR